MQLVLAGPLDRKASVAASEQEGETVDEVWVCYVCGTKNGSEVDDEMETEQCTRCARLRDPRWLLLEKSGVQLQLGSQVRLLDDVNFGAKVAVVSGVGFIKRRIQVLSVCSKFSRERINGEKAQEGVSGANERRGKFIFELSELDETHIQQLQHINADDEAANDLLRVLKQHGLCGECRRVFRIAQGDIKEEESSRELIQELERDLHKWNELKSQSIKLKEHARTLECTDRLKALALQLSRLKRSVEFLQPLRCPHCGWTAS